MTLLAMVATTAVRHARWREIVVERGSSRAARLGFARHCDPHR